MSFTRNIVYTSNYSFITFSYCSWPTNRAMFWISYFRSSINRFFNNFDNLRYYISSSLNFYCIAFMNIFFFNFIKIVKCSIWNNYSTYINYIKSSYRGDCTSSTNLKINFFGWTLFRSWSFNRFKNCKNRLKSIQKL